MDMDVGPSIIRDMDMCIYTYMDMYLYIYRDMCTSHAYVSLRLSGRIHLIYMDTVVYFCMDLNLDTLRLLGCGHGNEQLHLHR
jgi:hypothetical protein